MNQTSFLPYLLSHICSAQFYYLIMKMNVSSIVSSGGLRP